MKSLTILSIFFLFCKTSQAQEGKYAQVNGTQIYYEIHGEGEPLLLLHGFTVSHKVWDDSVEELSKNYKLIA